MDVAEAVATRYSCRAFLPDKPVPESVVRDILQRAARAPSGGNLQPWIVHALAGESNDLPALGDQSARETRSDHPTSPGNHGDPSAILRCRRMKV